MINFRISEALIKQVKKVVKVHGECHVLGDGNFYTNKQTCERQRNFSNPDREEVTFMLSFYNIDDIPATVKDMEDAFYNARRHETKVLADNQLATNKNIIDMSDDDDDDELIEDEKPKRGRRPANAIQENQEPDLLNQ